MALLAKKLFQKKIVKVTFILYGSFAKTYKGHGTDRALVAGILGMEPSDEKLRYSMEIAKIAGLPLVSTWIIRLQTRSLMRHYLSVTPMTIRICPLRILLRCITCLLTTLSMTTMEDFIGYPHQQGSTILLLCSTENT